MSTKPKTSSLTHDRLRSLIWYDPETGRGGRVGNANPLPMKPTAAGYNQIWVDGRIYYWHRLVWFYMTGAWPREDIDHLNRDRSDNRWSNLREATRSQNLANRPMDKRNAYGLKGVSFHKESGLWRARSRKNGKEKCAYFDCPAAAHFAYIVMADQEFGAFSRAS